MKQYVLNEETWKLFMIALNKAPYDLVIPVLEKIKTEVKLVMSTEQISEQKEDSKTEMA